MIGEFEGDSPATIKAAQVGFVLLVRFLGVAVFTAPVLVGYLVLRRRP